MGCRASNVVNTWFEVVVNTQFEDSSKIQYLHAHVQDFLKRADLCIHSITNSPPAYNPVQRCTLPSLRTSHLILAIARKRNFQRLTSASRHSINSTDFHGLPSIPIIADHGASDPLNYPRFIEIVSDSLLFWLLADVISITGPMRALRTASTYVVVSVFVVRSSKYVRLLLPLLILSTTITTKYYYLYYSNYY